METIVARFSLSIWTKKKDFSFNVITITITCDNGDPTGVSVLCMCFNDQGCKCRGCKDCKTTAQSEVRRSAAYWPPDSHSVTQKPPLTSAVKYPVAMGAMIPGMVAKVLVIPSRNPAYLQTGAQRCSGTRTGPEPSLFSGSLSVKVGLSNSCPPHPRTPPKWWQWALVQSTETNSKSTLNENILPKDVDHTVGHTVGHTDRGAMSIWLMKTPAELIPPVVVESVRKVTVRAWLQPT